MTSKGKRLTYLTIALGVLVLLVAGYAAKDLAAEQWYIWKLESEDEQSRTDAAAKLAEMGAVGAILKILGRPSVASGQTFVVKYPSSTELVPYLWKLTSVAGKRSVPSLVTALDDKGWYAAYLSALLLGRMGPNARGAIPALTTALRHECESVRNAAARALQNIHGEPTNDAPQR